MWAKTHFLRSKKVQAKKTSQTIRISMQYIGIFMYKGDPYALSFLFALPPHPTPPSSPSRNGFLNQATQAEHTYMQIQFLAKWIWAQATRQSCLHVRQNSLRAFSVMHSPFTHRFFPRILYKHIDSFHTFSMYAWILYVHSLCMHSRGLQFYTFFGISIGIIRRMIDNGKK